MNLIYFISNENTFVLEAFAASPSSSKNGKTLKELDNVYNKRLPARVVDFSAEYEKDISSEAASRENKFRQAEQAYKKAYVNYFQFLLTSEIG